MKHRVTLDRFNELFYWGNDGVTLWWKVGIRGHSIDTEAGSEKAYGYWTLNIDHVMHKRADLVWWRETGQWPRIGEGFVIDHIDYDKLNDNFPNLQEITELENKQRIRSINTSGFKGVHWHKVNRKWQTYLRVGGRQLYLGSFDELQDAVAARADAERYYGIQAK